MSGPTEADKELALDLVDAVREARTLTERTEARMAIASALSAEREKARAPFLALAESCDRATEVEGISYERSTAYSITAARIRRAAEES